MNTDDLNQGELDEKTKKHLAAAGAPKETILSDLNNKVLPPLYTFMSEGQSAKETLGMPTALSIIKILRVCRPQKLSS